MAPTEIEVEAQTSEIIKFLLEDDEERQCRTFDCCLEVDSVDDSFDPVLIADKLRTVADALNEDARVKAVLTELRGAAVQEAVETAFSQAVEVLCQNEVSQRPEVSSEMQLIRASVNVGLYLKKVSPDLKNKVQSVMTSFLNRRVGKWVTEQGGWGKVNIQG